MKTLVIGDAHSTPEHENSRFIALGNYIVETQPDNIVQMGDWNTFDSVSFFTKRNPVLAEGKRFKDDVDCGIDAYEKMWSPIRQINKRLSVSKRKQYNPTRYWLEANHEARVRSYISDKPELQGFIPENDFVGAEKDGWVLVPYKEYVYIDGVGFTHIPHYYANMAITGKYVVRRAIDISNTSLVFSHTHRFIYDEWARVGDEKAKKIQVLNCGWFGDYCPDYTIGGISYDGWWSGLVVLDHLDYGHYDYTTISMSKLKEKYL